MNASAAATAIRKPVRREPATETRTTDKQSLLQELLAIQAQARLATDPGGLPLQCPTCMRCYCGHCSQ